MSSDPWTPSTGALTECDTCGNTVTSQFARVFGDNNDDVDHCPNCSVYREIHDGANRS